MTIKKQVAAAALVLGIVAGAPAMAAHANQATNSPAHVRLMDPCKNPGGDPKCDVPQSPGTPLGLPAVGLAIVGGYALFARKRHFQAIRQKIDD